jgi:hypothetical protein
VTGPSPAFRLWLLAAAVATWLACFAISIRLATWTPFALAGVALATLSLAREPDARALLRPSYRSAGIGLGAGLLMVVLTHAAFALVASLLPEVRSATARLFGLLHAADVPLLLRASLIAIIAASEEIVFRGTVAGGRTSGELRLGSLTRHDVLRVVALAAVYAAAMLTAGSLVLVACAFACGAVWGTLRVTTCSLTAPIVAHVVWSLGVLLVWPVAA